MSDYPCQKCGRSAATRDHDVFMHNGKPICMACMITSQPTTHTALAKGFIQAADDKAKAVVDDILRTVNTLIRENRNTAATLVLCEMKIAILNAAHDHGIEVKHPTPRSEPS